MQHKRSTIQTIKILGNERERQRECKFIRENDKRNNRRKYPISDEHVPTEVLVQMNEETNIRAHTMIRFQDILIEVSGSREKVKITFRKGNSKPKMPEE